MTLPYIEQAGSVAFEKERERSIGVDVVLGKLTTPALGRTNVNNPADRYFQIRYNPYAYAHTYGLVNSIFFKGTRPFTYLDAEAEDIRDDSRLESMEPVHKEWISEGMYETFKEAVAQGLGVNSAYIVYIGKSSIDGKRKFVVFNPAFIEGNQFQKDPVTNEIISCRFRWPAAEIGYTDPSMKMQNGRARYVTGVIGKNMVEFKPLQSSMDPFGQAYITHLWSALVYKELNKYYSLVYNKKGGVVVRKFITPDNITDEALLRIKREAIKGIQSELVVIQYPSALATNPKSNPADAIQYNSETGQSIDFKGLNEIVKEDSDLPPSFVAGPASGALGGQAPQEDRAKTMKFLMGFMAHFQDFVKDINSTFYGVERDDYIIAPPFDEEGEVDAQERPAREMVEEEAQEAQETEEEEEEAGQQAQFSIKNEFTRLKRVSLLKRRKIAKFSNGIIPATSKAVVYEGNMIESGEYAFPEMGATGKLSAVEVSAWVNDNFRVKQGYITLEHSDTIIGVFNVQGFEFGEGGRLRDKTTLAFKPNFDPRQETIFLSPMMSMNVEFDSEDTFIMRDIDIREVGLVHYPRSHLTDQETSARRQ